MTNHVHRKYDFDKDKNVIFSTISKLYSASKIHMAQKRDYLKIGKKKYWPNTNK